MENNKEQTIVTKVRKLFERKDKQPLTAQMAWYCSKHANGTYKELSERIVDKQKEIAAEIRSRFDSTDIYNKTAKTQSAYHCVVEISEDLLEGIDEIFKPFLETGFEVINLSAECRSLKSDTPVYLISWLNAFKKKEED